MGARRELSIDEFKDLNEIKQLVSNLEPILAWVRVSSSTVVSNSECVGRLSVEGRLHDSLLLWLVLARAWRLEVVLVGVSTVKGVGGSAVLALTGYARVRVVGWTGTTFVLELAAFKSKRVCWRLIVDTAGVVLLLANESRQA